MKIILAVDSIKPSLTGIGRYTWELAERLSVHPGIEEIRYYARGLWISDYRKLTVESGLDALAGKPGSLSSRVVRGVYRHVSPLIHRMALRSCKDFVFHSPNFYLPPFSGKTIVTIHDLSPLKFPEFHPAERVAHLKHAMRKAGDQADLLLTDSEYTRTELIEDFGLAGDRVVAVPLGVAPEYHPRSRGEAAAVLDKYDLPWQSFSLCVATVEPRKNIQGLLAAYRGLPAGLRAECPLVLVGGKGWNSDAIHAEINEAVGEGWLKYLGFVAESELPLVYAAAKAFLFPSWYEGYGLPVLQAMASGVPCLSSDRSSLPEVSLDAAWLVDPADGPAVLEGTHRVLTDEAWRRQAAAKGLVIARTKTWDECARRTFEVYRRVADGSR